VYEEEKQEMQSKSKSKSKCLERYYCYTQVNMYVY